MSIDGLWFGLSKVLCVAAAKNETRADFCVWKSHSVEHRTCMAADDGVAHCAGVAGCW